MASREVMLRAIERRNARFRTRLEWYGNVVRQNIHMGMLQRLKIVGQLLRDKVVINISIPVVKQVSKITGRVRVVERSKPGEFPRADTTRLMKDIFWELNEQEQSVRVGTTLDYGLYLELNLDRSFLRRTTYELAEALGVILGTEGGGTAGRLPGQE